MKEPKMFLKFRRHIALRVCPEIFELAAMRRHLIENRMPDGPHLHYDTLLRVEDLTACAEREHELFSALHA